MTGYLGPRALSETISETDGLKWNLSQVLLLTDLRIYSDIFLPKLYGAEPSSLLKNIVAFRLSYCWILTPCHLVLNSLLSSASR